MSVYKRYTIREFANAMKKLPAALKPAIHRGIVSGVARSIAVVQDATTKAPPASANGSRGAVNTGAYRGAWRMRKTSTGASLFNLKKYAVIIEDGRRPGAKQPPSRVIEMWARRKLGLSPKQAKAAAFPIARAIAKRGLKPRLVLTNVQPKIMKLIREEIRHEIKLALRR